MNNTVNDQASLALTTLAAWIDEQLADESAERQRIAEEASARIKDVTLQILGVQALARQAQASIPGSGPLETEQEAQALPAVAAVYGVFAADPGVGKMAPHNLRMLTDACSTAGVELGEYDRRILRWLSGWEPATCAVVAGLITRADMVRSWLNSAQLVTILDALDVAADYKRDRAANCPDCDADPSELCTTCERRLTRAEEYDRLAETLRGQR